MGHHKQVYSMEQLGPDIPRSLQALAKPAFQDGEELHEQRADRIGGASGGEAEGAAYEEEDFDCSSCGQNACPVSCPHFMAIYGRTVH